MAKTTEIKLDNLKTLFNYVNNGQSVRIDEYEQVSSFNMTLNLEDASHCYHKKKWQLEKQGDVYCFKTFDSYERAKRHDFFLPFQEQSCSFHYKKCFGSLEEYLAFTQKELREITNELIDIKTFIRDLREDKKRVSTFKNGKGEEIKLTRIKEFKFIVFKTKDLNQCGHKKGEDAIRLKLNEFIKQLYPNEPTQDEYSTLGCASRADTVVFSQKAIHVFEIKSEKDSFSRLEKQIEDYKQYAERITIVLHIKKLSAFIKNYHHLLCDVGLLVYYDKNYPLEQKSKSKLLSPTSNKISFLWSGELYHILGRFKGSSKLTSASQRMKVCDKFLTKKQAIHICNCILNDRFKSKNERGVMQNGYFDFQKELLEKFNLNYDQLQKRFDKIIKPRI